MWIVRKVQRQTKGESDFGQTQIQKAAEDVAQTVENTCNISPMAGHISLAERAATLKKEHSEIEDPERKEQTCCLVWVLTRECQFALQERQLVALHEEIRTYSEIVGAEAIEVSGTSGVLKCPRKPASSVTDADAVLRLGQLLCRWAVMQEPPLGLRVGIHLGPMKSIRIPDCPVRGYYGSTLAIARQLAESAPYDACVHFLAETKEGLCFFEHVTFHLTASDSYYLSPWTQLVTADAKGGEVIVPSNELGIWRREGGRRQSILNFGKPLTLAATSNGIVGEMSRKDFVQWLEKHGVDTGKFGLGVAITLDEFYNEVVVEKRSSLTIDGDALQRRMEIVRVSLCARDAFGTDRTLKLMLESMVDGRTRTRDEKLAAVVPQGTSWQDAVEQCFIEKLNMPSDIQKLCLDMESNWFKEERMVSRSIPEIETLYLTHEVRIRVIDPSHAELHVIGLPNMCNFTTSITSSSRTRRWGWAKAGEETSNADMLRDLLHNHRISTNDFEPGAFNDLLIEVYDSKHSVLRVRKGELIRSLQVVKVWVCTDIFSVPHVLVAMSKVRNGKVDYSVQDSPISMRMKIQDTWQQGVVAALKERLGLEADFIANKTWLDESTYQLSEEIEYSRSFPGLKSQYRIHEVTCHILSSRPSLGLPEGLGFTFTRASKGADAETACVVTTSFVWKVRDEDFDLARSAEVFTKELVDSAKPSREPDAKRQLQNPKPAVLSSSGDSKSRYLVEKLMQGKQTDWTRAYRAATRIRDPGYSCGDYLEDCVAAFPELGLYLYNGGGTMTSGRSSQDEYQRTIGAFFALYWLMRLDGDGRRSFTFGVSDTWEPLSIKSTLPMRTAEELGKREAFLEEMNWPLFEDVLITAGLLKPGKRWGSTDALGHDPERILTVLVLTAIHDIMKLQALCPIVDARHVANAGGEYFGYNAGAVVSDHDLALGYVLTYIPGTLPSYAGLQAKQRDLIRFTQVAINYNMGWFVQAEAPPGPLFGAFKAAILSGKSNPTDVAFCFVHWLTDLAGAEPYPQDGCEKFVLKFPQKVLVSFLDSFNFVPKLAIATETAVFEEYLSWRWGTHEPSLGPLPHGSGSIAKLRLVVMAQLPDRGRAVLDALDALTLKDRAVLEQELARTGCSSQSYRCDPVDEAGPCFLVYYAPALLQKVAISEMQGALGILAEVLRQARVLWPLSSSACDESVTVRIDALKELDMQAIWKLQAGECWLLERTSKRDAKVLKADLAACNEFDWNAHRMLFHSKFVPRVQFATPLEMGGSDVQDDREFEPLTNTARTALAILEGLPQAPDPQARTSQCYCWPFPGEFLSQPLADSSSVGAGHGWRR